MTAVLDRLDIDFLEKGVLEFEQQSGEVHGNETPELWNVGCTDCSGSCSGNCAVGCGGSCYGAAGR